MTYMNDFIKFLRTVHECEFLEAKIETTNKLIEKEEKEIEILEKEIQNKT